MIVSIVKRNAQLEPNAASVRHAELNNYLFILRKPHATAHVQKMAVCLFIAGATCTRGRNNSMLYLASKRSGYAMLFAGAASTRGLNDNATANRICTIYASHTYERPAAGTHGPRPKSALKGLGSKEIQKLRRPVGLPQ